MQKKNSESSHWRHPNPRQPHNEKTELSGPVPSAAEPGGTATQASIACRSDCDEALSVVFQLQITQPPFVFIICF
ncbi:MAG: hypothetical protein ACK54P_05695, partial [Bacteroidota bacterium]